MLRDAVKYNIDNKYIGKINSYRERALELLNNTDPKHRIFNQKFIELITKEWKLDQKLPNKYGGNRKYKRKSFRKKKSRQRRTRCRK